MKLLKTGAVVRTAALSFLFLVHLPALSQGQERNVLLDAVAAVDTVPSDFPRFTILVNDNPSPDKLFISPVVQPMPRYSYLAILDGNASPIFYRRKDGTASNFTLQPNGLLTYFDGTSKCFYAMNANYAVVDSFRCKNGFRTDGHDLQVHADGHALLIGLDTRTVDMSAIVAGGHPQASVTGVVIQELDARKNVVFQWSSWDHFAITDATHEELTASAIDYVHANAIERDSDGNILLSSRHMDEITKIDRRTGAIIWRLGGRNNQFSFIGDTIGFSHQHDVRRLPNGNITLFDNGNYHAPKFSRAAEYRLDETRKTAELVWQYRNTPDLYAFATGNVQRLPNGNTLISWGTENIITEVRPDGSKAFEIEFPQLFTNYRAHRYAWTPTNAVNAPAHQNEINLSEVSPNPVTHAATISFSLAAQSFVALTVHDALGRTVVTLASEAFTAGTHVVRWNASSVKPGLYFYRLRTNRQTETKKLIVVK